MIKLEKKFENHSMDIIWPLLRVECISTFGNNCIFPYYRKCLANHMDAGKFHTIEIGKSVI